jgi:proton-dependent oligopeptide transporter, POT family
MVATTAAPLAATKGGFLGHPVGLAYLAFTEAWERFSFYGMQALLVLYMVDQLLRPGHIEGVAGFGVLRAALEAVSGPLSTQALASQVFGLYTAFVYVTPVFGGMLGDRVLGRRRAITIGAVAMAAGHFLMVVEGAFLLALVLLILGCGLVKGNIASQVGGLYDENDNRRSDAFQIFTLAINVGVIGAPLICGTLGEVVGWHYGFAAAGVGMLIGLGIYLAGRKHLPPDGVRRGDARAAAKVHLKGADWRAIWALVVLLPILAVAFVGNNQIYNVYMIWARDNANLIIGGLRMPVTWLQSYDAAVSVAGLVFAVWFWRRMAARGFSPHELTKLTVGCAISILGFAALAAAAAIQARTGVKVPLPWLLAFHVINTLGYVNILPVALALFSRAAPSSVNATMIGVFYLLFFAANLMVGWIGGLYGAMTPASFWSLHAGLCAASTGALVLLWRPLRTALAPHRGW